MAQTFIDFMSCLHSYCDALIPCTFLQLQLQLSFFNVHCSWQLLRLINLELHPFYQIDLSAFQSPKSKRKKKKRKIFIKKQMIQMMYTVCGIINILRKYNNISHFENWEEKKKNVTNLTFIVTVQVHLLCMSRYVCQTNFVLHPASNRK